MGFCTMGQGESAILARQRTPGRLVSTLKPWIRWPTLGLGGESGHELGGGGAESGESVVDIGEAALDRVDLAGDVLGIRPNRRDGGGHAVRGERGLVDGGGDH